MYFRVFTEISAAAAYINIEENKGDEFREYNRNDKTLRSLPQNIYLQSVNRRLRPCVQILPQSAEHPEAAVRTQKAEVTKMKRNFSGNVKMY